MKIIFSYFRPFFIKSLLLSTIYFISIFTIRNSVFADTPQIKDATDITHYVINAEVLPNSQLLRSTAIVTLTISRPVQSLVFELNGSLEITKVIGPNKEPLQFVQDRIKDLNVRIALSQIPEINKEFSLTFEYSGQLTNAEGGVLTDKRLAYIGKDDFYLLYAARWFPFHAYASDIATYKISITTPADLKVVAFGQHTEEIPLIQNDKSTDSSNKLAPQTKEPNFRPKSRTKKTSRTAPPPTTVITTIPDKSRIKHTFTSNVPILPGTIAGGRYIVRSLKQNDLTIDYYVKPGHESAAESLIDITNQICSFYKNNFGQYPFTDNTLRVAEIDTESLDSYTTAGMTLFRSKEFENNSNTIRETLGREIAYQWWGQGIVLKTFDDAFLSQGLATFSYLLFEQTQMRKDQFADLCKDFSERALAFENQASIARAPSELDDQSAAYKSIVYYKGAYVFRMLESVIGKEKLANLIKTYYLEYKSKQVGIADFEALASKSHGSNLRYFFGQWVDSTGVPEFRIDYQILKTKENTYRVRGTIEQNIENFNFPVDIALEYKDGTEKTQVQFNGKSADFILTVKSSPGNIVIDPDNHLLHLSDETRTAVLVRRAIQHMQAEEYAEAQQQFEAAIKLNPYSSWSYYNLGLLYLQQQNYQRALDTLSKVLDGDLKPTWLESWTYLKRGNAYDLLGQRDRAVAEYKKVSELGDNTNNIQELAQNYINSPYKN